jgi:hypothetical protein
VQPVRGQEPGNPEEIATFCRVAYDVTFPVFAKVDVNGPNTHPLYAFLKGASAASSARRHQVEFHEVPCSRDGKVAARFGPRAQPRRLSPPSASFSAQRRTLKGGNMEYLHTMVRVKDLDHSLDWYCNKLGLVEVRRTESQAGRFTLVFLAAPGDMERAKREMAPAGRAHLQLGHRGLHRRPQFRPPRLQRR